MHTESQYGQYFVPPYNMYPTSEETGYNSNLNIQTPPDGGRYFAGYTIKDQEDGGFGDHGYIYSGLMSEDIAQTEQLGIPAHHKMNLVPKEKFTSINLAKYPSSHTIFNPSSYPIFSTDPATHYIYGLSAQRAYLSGTYTGAIQIGLGIPWKTGQGANLLWNDFFSKHCQISELDWGAGKDYYHYLFGCYLSSFVLDFLSNFATNNSEPSKGSDTPNGGFFHFATDDTLTKSEKMDYVDSMKNTFLNAKDLVFADSSTLAEIQNLKTTWAAKEPGKDLQQWFLGESGSPDDVWFKDSSSTLQEAFGLFMKASNIYQRRDVTFIWVMHEVVKMLGKLEATTEIQSQRLLALSQSQSAAVSDIARIGFDKPKSTKDVTAINHNSYMSGYIEQYRSRQQMSSQYSSQTTSTVSATQSASQQQSTLMATVIKQMDGLIRGIFNR